MPLTITCTWASPCPERRAKSAGTRTIPSTCPASMAFCASTIEGVTGVSK